jgi:hypothetical protein
MAHSATQGYSGANMPDFMTGRHWVFRLADTFRAIIRHDLLLIAAIRHRLYIKTLNTSRRVPRTFGARVSTAVPGTLSRATGSGCREQYAMAE